MKICELILKNFGKFTDRRIVLSEGIQVLYGENESGKSTIHAFIKGMLFGMERGRGRAANRDAFSRYEPWENPGFYSGKMVFETSGRHFMIERHFDRHAKRVSLVCQEDGEELSVEDGDLQVLLDGLNASSYDNTISVAQLKAEPGSSLSAELRNYATNYYVAGDSELNLEEALLKLGIRKKEIEKRIRDSVQEKQEKRDRLEQEMSYVWRDIHRITEEQERLEAEIVHRRAKEEKREQEEPEVKQRVFDEIRPPRWRIHPLEVIGFAAGLVASFLMIPRPVNSFVTVLLLVCGLIYIWNRMKISKEQMKTEPERILEEITPEEEKLSSQKLRWEYEHNAAELREKSVQYENLKESLEELCGIAEEHKEYEDTKCAVQLAAQRLVELSEKLRRKLKQDMNACISEIICEITDGKYDSLLLEEEMSLSVLSKGRKIPAEQLSQGTLEQIYFAFRMAAGELLYGEDYPVILDDAFVCYDDTRLAHTLAWLHKNRKQVILFTCQNREEEQLKRMGIPYEKESI